MEVLEAIRKRRSIRKFKSTPISDQQIERLVEAAQLAPSGSNVQPWRFVIVKDKELKGKLCEAAFNQRFVEEAPIVIVCCGDLLSWKKGDVQPTKAEMLERIPLAFLNVAIAIEHIVLEAVELGLGSCWVRRFDEKKLKEILILSENLCVVALLPIGVPDGEPEPKPRLSTSAIILQTKKQQ